MKHLFVINPMASRVKGKLNAVIESIHAFFQEYPQMRYDIHVTRWERDALGVIRRHAMDADELLRVHVMGGSGTLFEAVGGVVDLPNAHLAVYPFGRQNYFLRYFGADKVHLFSSVRSQVFSNTIPIDAIRCGSHYGVAYLVAGLEAAVYRDSLDKRGYNILFTEDISMLWAAVKFLFGNRVISQNYRVRLDGQNLDGDYITMMIANGPCYGKTMRPAPDAHPNDGVLDVYAIRDMPRLNFFTVSPKYLSGKYKELQGRVTHHRGAKISISAESPIPLCMDGQMLYESAVDCEVLPYAVDFVCPGGVDMPPRIQGSFQ